MKYPVTIEALEVLDAIDRKGSFAAAAEGLYRVPSAITYTIKKLEQDLDLRLFYKQGRRSVLTPAGEVLLVQGRHILLATERLAQETKKAASGWEPKLNIAMDAILSAAFIYPIIEEFYRIHADIEINLSEEVLQGAWESIEDGRADLVIGAGQRSKAGQGVTQAPLTPVQWIFVVAPSHPLAQQTQALSENRIAQHRAIVVRDSARHQPALTHRVFSKDAVLSVHNMQEKIAALCQGLGVGFLPEPRARECLQQGKLIALEVVGPPSVAIAQIAWKTANEGKALHWFVQRVIAHFE